MSKIILMPASLRIAQAIAGEIFHDDTQYRLAIGSLNLSNPDVMDTIWGSLDEANQRKLIDELLKYPRTRASLDLAMWLIETLAEQLSAAELDAAIDMVKAMGDESDGV